MIAKDENGDELIDVLKTDEGKTNRYSPITHSMVIVKIGNEYLMGRNHFRKSWEIFGGCVEKGESTRDCIVREINEELGLENSDCKFIGLMKYKKAPSNFNPEPHIEYGGLYGMNLSKSSLDTIRKYRKDRAEIESLSFYSDISDKSTVSVIAEKLLKLWQ